MDFEQSLEGIMGAYFQEACLTFFHDLPRINMDLYLSTSTEHADVKNECRTANAGCCKYSFFAYN